MVRLEWADIEAFDAAEYPVLTQAELASLGEDPVFHLQPNLQLLDLAYPVDELLLKVRETEEPETDISSNVVMMDHSDSSAAQAAAFAQRQRKSFWPSIARKTSSISSG